MEPDRGGKQECERGLIGFDEETLSASAVSAPTEEGERVIGGIDAALPHPPPCIDTAPPLPPPCKWEALMQRHQDTLVGRIEGLLREQAQALRKEFGNDVVRHDFAEADDRSSGTPQQSGAQQNGTRPSVQPEAPVRASEVMNSVDSTDVAPAVIGKRRGSVRGVGAAVPDMITGALELRKRFKGKMILNLSTPDKGLAVSKFRETHPFRGFLRQTTLHPFFDTFFAVIVVFSVVLIGWEIEVKSRNPNANSDLFFLSQVMCCVLFIIELIFRAGAQGLAFLGSKDYKWNVFDLVCLGAMMMDLSSEVWIGAIHSDNSATGAAASSRVVRVLRLLRIIRALRIMRATRASREFRKMSYALQYSAQTLFWALLLLGFVMYFFAATFTQATSEALLQYGVLPQDVPADSNMGQLVEMYGSIPNSFQSLFMAIASGRDWHELVAPISQHLHWVFAALYFAFIAVTVFGIMNVLTSVFVESALQSVQHYKDLLIQESVKAKRMYVEHLREVFREIDTDNSGSITLEELEHFLTDPALMLYLESMDIQPDDARTLFRLIDKDDSGDVSIEEFCQGCLRLKGDAKSFDIHCIIYENHRLLFKWKEYMSYMETGLLPAVKKVVEDALDKRQDAMDKRRTTLKLARQPTLDATPSVAQGSPRVAQGRAPSVIASPSQNFSEPARLCSAEGPEAPPAPLRVQMMSLGSSASSLLVSFD